MDYFIGIDGGGTKTRLVAATFDGNKQTILGRASGGSSNLAALPFDTVFANIQKLLHDLHSTSGLQLQHCRAICLGSAGATAGDNTARLTQIFRMLGYSCALNIMNDAEMVLFSQTRGQPGAILISGTGSIGYAINMAGDVRRVGGWGHLIDDGGSGYRLGMDAICAALMDWDGRGAATKLTHIVAKFFDGEKEDIADVPRKITGYIYGTGFEKSKIAELAPLIRHAAEQGDVTAHTIEKNAATDLVHLAHTLIRHAGVNDCKKIVISGGVILNNSHIRKMFEAGVLTAFPLVEVVEMAESAEIGAAWLAMQSCKENSHLFSTE